jgi:hypothetical protein
VTNAFAATFITFVACSGVSTRFLTATPRYKLAQPVRHTRTRTARALVANTFITFVACSVSNRFLTTVLTCKLAQQVSSKPQMHTTRAHTRTRTTRISTSNTFVFTFALRQLRMASQHDSYLQYPSAHYRPTHLLWPRSLLLASQCESQPMHYRRTNANDTYVQRPHVYYAHALERA